MKSILVCIYKPENYNSERFHPPVSQTSIKNNHLFSVNLCKLNLSLVSLRSDAHYN